MLGDEFPGCGGEAGVYDAYAAFGGIAPLLRNDDLVLLDPFGEFLRDRDRAPRSCHGWGRRRNAGQSCCLR